MIGGPAMAGPPFVTDDPEPVDAGHCEINVGLTGTLVRGAGAASLLQIDANYGLLPDLQLHVQPQLAYANDRVGSEVGPGDTEIGAKYRFVQEDDEGWTPMIAIYPRFEIPTGDRKRGLGGGVGRSFLPVWAEKTIGRWAIDGGVGYWIDPGAMGRNAWFAGGLILYKVTDSLQLGGEAFVQTAQTVGTRDAAGFNLGGAADLSKTYHILFSAGRGLANVPSTNQLSGYMALQITF